MSDVMLDVYARLRDAEKRLARLEAQEQPRGLISSGASFPGSPAADDRFFRTDLDWLCVYDGTRWLTVHEYALAFGIGSGAYATNYAASAADVRRAAARTDYRIWLTYGSILITTGAVNSGVNFFGYTFVDSAGLTVWTSNTSADAASVTVVKATSVFTQPVAAINSIRLDLTAAGAPSAQFPYTPVLYYRFIVT